MVKILHTSDLHIGKRLYQAELYQEQQLFFDWLTAYIEKEKVNVLLISGDVFDVANPSSDSRRVYYDLLRKLMLLKCKVIVTGGNHDSPSMLEAPGELLKHLDIHVLGSLPENTSEVLVPVFSNDGKPLLVVAAVPYLRDSDIRRRSEDQSYDDRLEAIKEGIVNVFTQLADCCKQQYPGVPAIAMGHLYLQNGTLSESERDIQIGNQAGLPEDKLPAYFEYYALGHLHQPQSLGQNRKMCYSGSPVQLSFSEHKNNNRVMLLELNNGELSTKPVLIPVNRRLLRLKGSVKELKQSLDALPAQDFPLSTFIELEAIEQNHDPAMITELQTVMDSFIRDDARILKHRISFINKPKGTATLFLPGESIADRQPMEVFEKKIEHIEMEDAMRQTLKEAFSELLEEVLQKQEE